jgi:hypothetical protein
MALAFDYTAAELLPLLPKVQEAVAGALSLPSTPDGVGRVRVAIRGALRRRLALPSQRRLAEATPTATTTVDVSVAMPSADAAAAAAAALTADGINAQLQASTPSSRPSGSGPPPSCRPPSPSPTRWARRAPTRRRLGGA